MFGPRITTVFRSRWNALFWAASVLLTAYCSVPQPEDRQADDAASVSVPDAGAQPEAKHVNPWAKDTPQ